MRSRLLFVALILAVAPSLVRAGPVRSLPLPPPGAVAHWDANRNADPQSYGDQGFMLTIFRRPTPRRGVVASMTIAAGGAEALRLDGAEGFSFAPVDFGVARLDAAADGPGVLFATNTGGAHCCSRVLVGEAVKGRWKAIRVGEFDADAPRFLPIPGAAGIYALATVDDAFDYTFASFAGSYRPPAIYEIRDARVWDVSADPKYRPLFERDLSRAQAACTGGDPKQDEVNGACAAMVADAARLGRLAQAWPIMLAHYDRTKKLWQDGCGVPKVGGACPKGQTFKFPDFPSALKAFLRETGYIRPPGALLAIAVKPSPGVP